MNCSLDLGQKVVKNGVLTLGLEKCWIVLDFANFVFERRYYGT